MDVQQQQLVQNIEDSDQQIDQEPLQSQISQPSPKKAKPRNLNICSNKICPSYKPTKNNLSNPNNSQHLCPDCIKQYKKQFFCFYCKQIYFQTTDDGKEWIMCDDCQKWVHTQCADFSTFGSTTSFTCLRCRKIDVNPANQSATASRRNNQTRSNNSLILGSKVPERRKTQECMLNNFGFYWQLSPQELAQDVEKLKQMMK